MGATESAPRCWLEAAQVFFDVADSDGFAHGQRVPVVQRRVLPLTTSVTSIAIPLAPGDLSDVHIRLGGDAAAGARLGISGRTATGLTVNYETNLALALQLAHAELAAGDVASAFGTIRGLVIYPSARAFAKPKPGALLPDVRAAVDLRAVDGVAISADAPIGDARWDGGALLWPDRGGAPIVLASRRAPAEAPAVGVVGVCSRGATPAELAAVRAAVPFGALVLYLDVEGAALGLTDATEPRAARAHEAYGGISEIYVAERAAWTPENVPGLLACLLIGAGVRVRLVALERDVRAHRDGAEDLHILSRANRPM